MNGIDGLFLGAGLAALGWSVFKAAREIRFGMEAQATGHVVPLVTGKPTPEEQRRAELPAIVHRRPAEALPGTAEEKEWQAYVEILESPDRFPSEDVQEARDYFKLDH